MPLWTRIQSAQGFAAARWDFAEATALAESDNSQGLIFLPSVTGPAAARLLLRSS